MLKRGRTGRSAALILAGFLLALAPPASAHVEEKTGPFALTLGWGEEPALTGAENYVEVDVARAASGAPVEVRPGALSVEVTFGTAARTLPLLPSGGPGKLRAVLVPTRPGTYGFHVTGQLRGEAIDVQATCSGATFDCVTEASELQFPARDPSAGQIAQRLARALPRAEDARDEASSAHTLALAALVAALLALLVAVAVGVRVVRRKGV
jgi:hypothetical protein